MTYILKSNFSSSSRNQGGNGKKILKLGIVAALITVLFFILSSTFAGFSAALISPFIKGYNGVATSLGRGFSFLTPKANLISENESLKREVNELEGQILMRERLLNSEDSSLGYTARIMSTSSSVSTSTAVVSLPPVTSFKELVMDSSLITAAAISFPPRTPYDSVLIDVGSAKGIEEGAIVFTTGNVAVGKIEAVFLNQARVRLFSSADIKTEVIVERTGEPLEISGLGGNTFKVEVPISFDAIEGDAVLLPGENHVTIAVIAAVKENDDASSISIFFTTPAKINGKTILYVSS